MPGSAAILSWHFDWTIVSLLLAAAAIYLRGWLIGRKLLRTPQDENRLLAFYCGLLAIFLALESPLDTFDSLFISAHMTQHLLLMMIAPPLLLLGDPYVPLLRGLPKGLVKEGLGPFLTWPLLRRVERWITLPPVAWLVFALSSVLWHVPQFYELALRDPKWHAAQHACFFWTGILFWWPVVFPAARWPRWIFIPYLLLADGLNTAISAFFVFSDSILYPFYGPDRIGGLSARGDQAAAGAIMWVPGSMVYLIPAIYIGFRLFSLVTVPTAPRLVNIALPARARRKWPVAKLRRGAQLAVLLLAIAVMADGFTGTQVAPLNLAGTLPWIYWRALSVFALLLVGNLFCMACPFTLVRDVGRTFLPARMRWPRFLRSKWLPSGLILIYLWSYEAFGLWSSPWMTAWIIAGYFLAAVTVDGIFRGASFCKYVCPIGQFHFITSLVSPREVRVRSLAVCRTCITYDCIRGNSRARGCELQLFQPKKSSNLDCTFCMDCVQACPHDNVALLPVAPAATLTVDPHRSSLGRLSKRTDIALLALVIVFGAFVNAAGMARPVMRLEHGWHARLGPNSLPAIVAAFVLAGVVVPALFATLLPTWRRFALALVPVGVAMWASHLLYHVNTFGSSRPAQILLLDAGLLLTLYVNRRIAKESIRHLLPWAAVSGVLYLTGIWIVFQPMEMRGMIH